MIRTMLKSGVPYFANAILAVALVAAVPDAASAADRKKREEPPAPFTFQGPARLAVVSLARQHVTFYNAEGGSVRAPISSGQSGMDTPVGVYSILQKKVDHTSNIYDDAKMPFMQRITWSGVALHAGALPGYPASHGCVRLPIDFAENIFGTTNLGLRVVISRDDVAPAAIEHASLFQPKPLDESALTNIDVAPIADEGPPLMPDVANWSLRYREQVRLRAAVAEKVADLTAAAEIVEPLKPAYEEKAAQQKKFLRSAKVAEGDKAAAEKRITRAEKAVAAAKKPKVLAKADAELAKAKADLEKAVTKLQPFAEERERIESAFAAAKSALDAAEAKRAEAAAAHEEARRKLLPISVFVSLDTKRLYVRQGHAPVMDTEIEIRDPDMPIGTHVFTALDYAPDGSTARWNVVSLARADESIDEFESFNRRRKAERRGAQQTEVASAAAALDRIVIPADLRDKLSDYVWPGASLIISDEPMHKKETNASTDFVVLLSGYPQGGIKKRPPPPPMFYDDGPYLSFWSSPSPYDRRQAGPRYYAPNPYGSRPYATRQRYKKPPPSLFSWW